LTINTNKISITEEKVFVELGKIGLHPEMQYQIDRLCVDFAFVKEKIAIEIDGPQHLKPEQKKKDGNRDDFLQTKGWKIRRFLAEEAYNNPTKIAQQIKYFLLNVNKSKKPSKEADTNTKKTSREIMKLYWTQNHVNMGLISLNGKGITIYKKK